MHKKISIHRLPALLVGLAAAPVLTGCQFRDLCYEHPDHALKYETRVEASWVQEWEFPYDGLTDWAHTWDEPLYGLTYNELRPAIPDGLRAVVYKDGKNNITNLPPEGGIVRMAAGLHDILFYNNDSEFVLIDNKDSYPMAMATTRSRTRESYLGSPVKKAKGRSEVTLNTPDMLYGTWVTDYLALKQQDPMELSITMHPLVFTYLVNYEFTNGAQYVGLARGALAGMAEGVYLSSGRTSARECTLLFDGSTKPWGVQARVMSFGIPDFPNPDYSRADREYGLNLEVRLKNGKVFTFDFDVTDQVERQPWGGVITVGGIYISDDDGKEGGSGFDVTVDGWGENEDIIIMM